MDRMPLPLFPITCRWIQDGAFTSAVLTEFAFSYTFVRAMPSFSWGPWCRYFKKLHFSASQDRGLRMALFHSSYPKSNCFLVRICWRHFNTHAAFLQYFSNTSPFGTNHVFVLWFAYFDADSGTLPLDFVVCLKPKSTNKNLALHFLKHDCSNLLVELHVSL